MRILTKIIFLFLFLLMAMNGHAQGLKFKHIGVEEGLSNSTIECIFQDSRGFMWFGTRDGLNKYDGKQVTVYQHSSDQRSLSDNYIRCIFEDRNKTIWVGTSNGLNKFNAQENSFIAYQAAPGKNGKLNNSSISSITETDKGLWIGTRGGGLNRLDVSTGLFTHFSAYHEGATAAGKTAGLNYINDIYADPRGRLWVATDNGICLFDTRTRSFQPVSGLEKYAFSIIRPQSDGSLWLGTEEKGLIHFNPQNQSIRTYRHEDKNPGSIGSDLVRAIAFDQHHKIWVGGINGGLNLLDPATSRFVHYQNEPGNNFSLSQRTVSALFVDRQDNLWIGTHRGGINLYSPTAEKFKLWQQEPNKNSLSYNDVTAFYTEGNGEVWIGTDGGGLNLYNRERNTFTHYKNNPFNDQSLGSDAVLDISKGADGTLLIGTWGGGLNLRTRDGNFIRYTHSAARPASISSDYVQKSFRDSKGNVWIGTYYGGLNLFDRASGTFKRITTGNNHSALRGNNVVSINEDQQQNLWIGTDDGGLNCYNLNTGVFSHYFLNGAKKPDLRVLFVDSKNNLWVGQAGLYLFDRKKNTFSIYTSKDGLATEFIKGMTEDDQGNFWISTSKGLKKFNPQTGLVKTYNAADGLQGLEFEANSCFKAKNGEMFFGGMNGYNSFFPNSIQTNKFVPPVYITEFKLFNQTILPGTTGSVLTNEISHTKTLELNHRQSTLSFSFASLNYTASENNNYSYKLQGLDKDWISSGSANKAFYTNLSPGEYTFMVRASNNDELWNNQGTSLKIIIRPPFWATWWFRLGVVIVVSYLVYQALSFRRNLELRKIEEQKREEIHQVQLQFFTNISHEFRTPLSLILGPIERLLKEDTKESFQHYYQTIYRNANRLLKLIEELMDFRKTQSGALKLNVTRGNLDLFIDEVAEEFADMALEKEITFSVEKQDLPEEVWFDRQVIEKIILNLINNSLKYTRSGGSVKLKIGSTLNGVKPLFENQLEIKSAYTADSYIYFQVIDSGIGISKESIHHLFERYYRITESHLGSGVGLAFVKSLTTLHKGTIFVSSERNKGTEIIIGIPSAVTDYSEEEQWSADQAPGGTRLESISYGTDAEKKAITGQKPQQTESKSQRSILIVDDNEELRSFLKQVLNTSYHILEAANGQSGFEMAKQELPDLIISDVMMPGISGTVLCKMIREDMETSHIPVLMLTAKNSVDAEIEGMESGADLYFSKPVNTSLLEVAVKNIFDQRQKLRDHYQKNKDTSIRDLAHSAKDKEFMSKMLDIIEKQLVNPEMDIDYLCTEIGMSRTKLYHKIKTLTGQSVGDFVRSVRLRKAVEIMTKEDVLMTEVMYRIGIQTQSYFTKAFKKEYGKTPTRYLQDLKQDH